MSARHIRTRLTLWHVSVLGVALVLYSLCASLLLLRDLRQQLVRHAIQDLETSEGLLYFGPDGKLNFRDDYHNHVESKLILERLLEVRALDGTLLYRNERLHGRTLNGPIFDGEGEGGYSQRRVRLSDGEPVQLVSRKHVIAGRPTLIRLGYSELPLWEQFQADLLALLLPLPLVLGLAGLGGYLLARRALQPIQQMARRAEEITGDKLHARLPVETADGELGDLARVFNNMLSRLELSFEQLRRFTSDASHELRTPLTAIRSVGEVGLRKPATPEEYRDIIGSMLEEATRLTRLVDSLLTISRADAGQIQLQPSRFAAMDLVRECASMFEVLLEERGLRLEQSGDQEAMIEGDWLLLRQAIFNIVHNAIKFSPALGTIRMSVHVEDSEIVLQVRDGGPGIPAADLSRVFDRFYRVDTGRAREAGGTGLGLAIAQWTVEAHAGSIQLDSKTGEGLTVLVRLPACNPKHDRTGDVSFSLSA